MENEVIRSLINHKSTRAFENRKIDEKILCQILNAGIRSANGGNLQGYSLIVIDDLEKLNHIGVYNTPLAIIALADAYRTQRWFELFGHANVPVNTTHGFIINICDALICLHSISIAAESLGLGTYYNGDITSMNIKNVINNPKGTFPIGMLCLGYPKSEGKLSDRLPLDAVVHYNSYKIPTDEEIKNWYSQKENLFQTRNSKERLAEFKKNEILHLADAYAKNKFKGYELEELSKGIKRNIKESGYDFI